VIVEIVILAMIAAFLGLRLYSVLGRRAEHEEEVVPTRFDQPNRAGTQAPQAQPAQVSLRPRELVGMAPVVEQGLRQIAAADRRFDLSAFIEGAKGAYGMILEAFWRGERDELQALCVPAVYQDFLAAIAARDEAGETLDNRLIRIEQARIERASLDGNMARISIRFVSDIAAVTRNANGEVVAGSLDDAVESQDVWTFVRDVTSAGPDWLLEETDIG
jgi:predicted lipid-binding transport protein (Tim44 family)